MTVTVEYNGKGDWIVMNEDYYNGTYNLLRTTVAVPPKLSFSGWWDQVNVGLGDIGQRELTFGAAQGLHGLLLSPADAVQAVRLVRKEARDTLREEPGDGE